MLHVEKTRSHAADPAAMWERIGAFDSIHTWHPAVADTKVGEEGKRQCVLGDGGVLFETETGRGELDYSYSIDQSPLPVTNYNATILVRGVKGGCEIVWSADFDAEGASDEEAADLIGGIFDAGLETL